MFHQPVLLQSVRHFLNVQAGSLYVDATLGGAGHTAAILASGGKVLGIDQDPEALAAAAALLSSQFSLPALPLDKFVTPSLVLTQNNFFRMTEIVDHFSWRPVSGIILDLGVSSHQLDTPSRGFSYRFEAPLDMRMDPELTVTAADLVNTLSLPDLAWTLRLYGEVGSAKSLAAKIISARPIRTTSDLVRALVASPHQIRLVFQALRIAVNDELGALKSVLPQALELLEPAGRLVVISFHSLEDRLVKDQFNTWAKQNLVDILTPTPVRPGPDELHSNPRSKSAKLRAIYKK